jgi:hypothetical protein
VASALAADAPAAVRCACRRLQGRRVRQTAGLHMHRRNETREEVVNSRR